MKDTRFSYEWKNGKVRQKVRVKDMELKPKDILDTLDQIRNQMQQMSSQEQKLMANLDKIKKDRESAKVHITKLSQFEDKCESEQIKLLRQLIKKNHEECLMKALKATDEEFSKDKNKTIDDDARPKLNYLKYEANLASCEDIRTQISNRIIKRCIYEEPVFENPFI